MPDSTLTEFDTGITNGIELTNSLTGNKVKFQFPPRITTESKTSNWKEKDIAAFEPYKVYRGAGPRSITLEFEYIATGSGDFTAQKIARYLREIKEYYYRANILDQKEKYPVFQLKAWDVVPGNVAIANFRLHNLTINYSSSMVRFSAERSLVSFPLHTAVTMSLALATNISIDGTKVRQSSKPLGPMQTEWF